MSKIVRCLRCDGTGYLDNVDEEFGNWNRTQLFKIKKRLSELPSLKRTRILRRLREILKQDPKRCSLCNGRGSRVINITKEEL